MFSNTLRMSKVVTSLIYWSSFLTLRIKYSLQTRQFSTWSTEHSHYHGYLKSSTMSLINGIKPILWQSHSSCRTEVFSIMLTRCGAKVGTYEMSTLLNALARLTSQPVNENFILSGVISRISMWSLSIAALILMIQNIIKRPFQKLTNFYTTWGIY